MNDLDLIRATLQAPPPSARATIQARNRLIAATTGPEPAPPQRRRPVLGWSVAGGAVLASVAVVALVVPLVTAPAAPVGPPGPAPGAAPGPADTSARGLLLAAASQASRAPDTTGRYWRVKQVGLGATHKVGSGANRYEVIDRGLTETWTARDPRQPSFEGVLDLGVRPRTPADERAWRRAGSPTQWVIPADTVSGSITLRTKPGKPLLIRISDPTDYLPEFSGLSIADLRRLPSDPARLRAVFVKRIAARSPGAPAGSPLSDRLLFRALGELLLRLPAPPPVRAAAFAALAEIPGVRLLGEVSDGMGRTGVGIGLTQLGLSRSSAGDRVLAEHDKLIIDPATHLVLATGYSARLDDPQTGRPIKQADSVVLTAAWTDQSPALPTAP